jgi:hypothetical protein
MLLEFVLGRLDLAHDDPWRAELGDDAGVVDVTEWVDARELGEGVPDRGGAEVDGP